MKGNKQMAGRLSRIVLAALTMLDGVALCRFPPSPGELSRGIAAPHGWVSRAGTDAAVGMVAGALLWLTALWLMLGLLVTLASRLAGRPDGLLEALSRRITPALIRRLVTTATGASLVFTPTTAIGAPMAPRALLTTIGAAMPGSPTGPSVTSSRAAETAPSLPLETTPLLPAESTPGPPLDPAPPAGTVLVKPGDSLWRITAQRLGPSATDGQIAVGWPYWYWANRQVIGRDPNLLRPGERLAVPTAQEGSSDG
jgi:resuscitation-promoting factor RpfA